MAALSDQSINRLSRILKGISNGSLAHNQYHIRLGTARCVCGWYTEFYSEGGLTFVSDPWEFASTDLGLTRAEARLLFMPSASRSLHQYTLGAFRDGRRLTGGAFIKGKYQVPYHSDNTYLVIGVKGEKYNTSEHFIGVLNDFLQAPSIILQAELINIK